MRTNTNGLAIILCLNLLTCFTARAGIDSATVNQVEQDKTRESALMPHQQQYQSSRTYAKTQTLIFPEEATCRYITKVDIASEDNAKTTALLGKIAAQAPGHCLGIEGIRLLTNALQNELITQGYITSLIDIPSQSLEGGILKITLTYGKTGHIDFAPNSAVTNLWTSMPTHTGKILRLSDLEQGMANLQRLPGASAHMKLRPGEHIGESDIEIARVMDKQWQVGAWLDDAGSRASGRYQGGGALYLYDLSSLNDILSISAGGDVEFNQHNDGNHNGNLYYSVPFGYWSLSLYGSYSQYRQLFKGRWSSIDYKSKNRYYSATLSRLLSHTRQQKTTADLRIAKSSSHYFFGGDELYVMRKQNPVWEFTVRHQHYFNRKIIDASLGVQRSLPWLSSVPTPEEKGGLYSHQSRIVHADIQALMQFAATGDKFSWMPRFHAQFSPDRLSSDNQFNIGNRWTVRGFDGENTLSANQGWYWRNDFSWNIPTPDQQVYLGLDFGRIIGTERARQGKSLSGAVGGVRGEIASTQYDFFIGTPISKPDDFHSDAMNLGFSLQWRY